MFNLLFRVKSIISSGLQAIVNEDHPFVRPASEESLQEGFECKDANAFGILLAVATLVITGVLIQFVFGFSFSSYKRHWMNSTPSQQIPPPDFLEGSAPTRKLIDYRTQMVHRLNSYGWVDREKRIVHIPIESAMKKIVDRSAHEK